MSWQDEFRILLIEDDHEDALLIEEYFRSTNTYSYKIDHITRIEKAIQELKSSDYEVILCDLNLPDSEGIETITQVFEAANDIPIIVLTGMDNTDIGIAALERGAQDYLVKGKFTDKQLVQSIQYSISRKKIEEGLRDNRDLLSTIFNDTPLILYLINEERRVVRINQAGAKIVSRSEKEAVGLSSGELLNCLNNLHNDMGCGSGPDCKSCLLRGSIDRCLNNGKNTRNRRISLPVLMGSDDGRKYYILSVTRITIQSSVMALVSLSDVTQIEESRIQADQNNTRLTSVIDNLPEGILIESSDGRVHKINRQFQDLFDVEVSPEKLVGSDIDIAEQQVKNSFEDPERYLTDIKTMLENKEIVLNHELILKSGKVVERDFIPVTINGHDSEIMWLYRDVTEKWRENQVKEAKLELVDYIAHHTAKESLVKFLDITEALTKSSIAFYHFVEDDQETISLQAWSSNTMKGICAVEPAECHYQISKAGVWVDCVKERKPIIQNDYQALPHKKGLPPGHVPVERELVVPIFRGDRIVAIVGVGNKKSGYGAHEVQLVEKLADATWDMFLRKQTEEKIIEERDRANNIIEGTDAGTWDWNIKTGELFTNERFSQIHGLDHVEWRNRTIEQWIETVHPDDVEYVEEQFNRMLENNSDHFVVEFRKKHKDDYYSWVLSRGKVIEYDKDENPVKIAGIILDISDRKKTELQLYEQYQAYEVLNEELKQSNENLIHAKEKAEESDRLKSAFLANMSHEIRTPMNGILGFAHLLNEPDLTLVQQKQYIDIIESSGQRMLNTLNDIIEISQIETGQLSTHPEYLDVDLLVQDLVKFVDPEIDHSKIIFEVENNSIQRPLLFSTDRDKLNGILYNLVRNAIKFTKSGVVNLVYDINDDNLEIQVKDTGIGIPPDKINLIFDRFIQVEQSHTRQFEGSGLGLSITKAYVELLHGTIRVESEINSGSSFYVSLPSLKAGKRS